MSRPQDNPQLNNPVNQETVYSRNDPERSIIVRTIADQTAVSYPSTWFQANRNSKPRINIKIRMTGNTISVSLAAVRNSLFQGILSSQPSFLEAMAFLYLKMRETVGILDELWTSYNTTIGLAQSEVTPLSLLDVTLHPDLMTDLLIGDDVNEENDLFIMAYLTSIYRYARANSPEYRTHLTNVIREFLRGLPGSESRGGIASVQFHYPGAANIGKGWENNPDYCRLICAIDMFFIRFPTHESASIRFGTQAARHKDCAALTIFLKTHAQLGFSQPAGLLRWLFTEDLENDVLRLFKADEEYDQNYSYFPYQVDMGLVTKSAYSTVACPSIYFFCSSILAINNDSRGLNARFTLQRNVNNVLCNAKLLTYAFTTTADLDIRFVTERPTLPPSTERNTEDQIEINILDRPLTKNPNDWLVYYTTNEDVRNAIDSFVRNRLNQNQVLRPNSVGLYIRQSTTDI